MKKTKKLIVPIALLVLAVMAVTSTTFAWFTSNSVVNAKTSNIKVSTDEEMLYIVSLDYQYAARTTPSNWTTNINNNIGTLFPDLDLTDLTYDDGNDDGKFYMKDLTATGTAGTNYLEFTYTFWYTDATASVYLDYKNSKLVSTGAKTQQFGALEESYFYTLPGLASDIEDEIAALDPVDDADEILALEAKLDILEAVIEFYGTQDIAKTGFVATAEIGTSGEAGYVPAYTALQNYQNAGHSVMVYDTDDWYFKANGVYTTDAINAARVLFTDVNSGVAVGNTNGNVLWNPGAGAGYDATYAAGGTGGWSEKFDVQNLYELVQTGLGGLPVASYDPYDAANRITNNVDAVINGNSTTITANTAKQKIASFDATQTVSRGSVPYYRAEVKIQIWLEGWDSDCFNVILGSVFGTDMTFTTIPPV